MCPCRLVSGAARLARDSAQVRLMAEMTMIRTLAQRSFRAEAQIHRPVPKIAAAAGHESDRRAGSER